MALRSIFHNGVSDLELEIFASTTNSNFSASGAVTYQPYSYPAIVPTTLMAYACLISLGREIDFIWSYPLRPVSWIYVLIRYPGMIYHLFQLVEVSLDSYAPSCTFLQKLGAVSELIAMTASYAFQVLRTHATCGRYRWYLDSALVLLYLPFMIIQCLAISSVACGTTNQPPIEVDIQLVFDFAFESVIFMTTLWSTWTQVRVARRLGAGQRTISECILRNGALYYGLFMVTGLPQIITLNHKGAMSSLVDYIFSEMYYPLRWVLLSQFILELREQSVHPNRSTSSLSSITSFRAAADTVQSVVNRDFGDVNPVSMNEAADSDSDPEHSGAEEPDESVVRTSEEAQSGVA